MYAQNDVSGIITGGNAGSPVAGAYVSIIHGKTISSYTFSDADGCFSLKCKDIGKDSLSISMLGYKPLIIPVSKDFMRLRLEESRLSLNASKIRSSVIEGHGDTTSYMAGAFRDANDKVLADILEKLPGIHVTESGGITHNGNYINKFYVEGLDLMGGRYGVVTKNLDADDIARIDVYRNHQPVRALKGVVNTDRSAVNIVLKESAKNSWMFNGDLALGTPEFPLFDAKSMLTRFSKRSQDLFLVKGNNVGSDISKELREQQYFGRTGAFLITDDNMESDFRTLLNPQRTILDLPKEYWYDNLSGIGSFNHLKKVTDSIQLRISLQTAVEKYKESSVCQEDIVFSDGSGLSIRNMSGMNDRTEYLSLKVTMEKNESRKFLSDEITLSGQWRKACGTSDGGSQDYIQSYRLPSMKMENVLKAVFRNDAGRAVDLSSTTGIILNNHSSEYEVDSSWSQQSLKCIDVYSRNEISRVFRAGPFSLNAYGAADISLTRRIAGLYCPTVTEITDSCAFTALSVIPAAGISTQFSRGRNWLHINIPVRLNAIFTNSVGHHIFPSFTPYILWKLSCSQSWEISASGTYRLSKSNPESLMPAAIMNSYRTIVLQNGLMTTETAQATGYVRYSDNPSMLYITLGGDITHTGTDKSASSTYSEAYTITGFVPGAVSRNSCGAKAQITKYFGVKALTIDFSGGLNRYRATEYLQGLRLNYTGQTTSAKLTARTSALKWLSAEITMDYSYEKIHSNSSTETHRIRTDGQISLKPWKKVSVYSSAFHLWLKSADGKTRISDLPLIKAGADMKFSKFSIFAECRNILDNTELKNQFTSAVGTSSLSCRLRGREFMAGIRMSL